MSNSAEKGKKRRGFEKGIRLFQAANLGAIAVEAVVAVIMPPVAPAMKLLIGINVLQVAGAEVVLQAHKARQRRKNAKSGASNAKLRYAT